MRNATVTIGTTFESRGKHKRMHTVIDIHTTTNLAGEVVKTEYLCTHPFMGQEVKSLECRTTIIRGLINLYA